MFSRVWGDKGTGNIVKNYVLERFYGDKSVNYIRVPCLNENIAKTRKHTSKNTVFGRFCGKNAANGANCRLESFSGRRRRGYLKFPSHAGEKIEKHPLGGSQGEEIVALDGPGCG